MSTKNIKIKEVVKYGGHTLNDKGVVGLTLKASYSELPNSIMLMQMLNNDMDVKARLPEAKAIQLGLFKIKQIIFDGDGESVIKLSGINDFIEMDNLNRLPTKAADVAEFVVLFEADIEIEESGEKDDDDEWGED